MKKQDLAPHIDWIIKNQSPDGSIAWDLNDKCDPWDHLECLIALAIWEEDKNFKKGIDWFLCNLDANSFIKSEFIKGQSSREYYEHHHAIYLAVPLYQCLLMSNNDSYVKNHLKTLKNLVEAVLDVRDDHGCFYWAQDEKGMCDNSLITATASIYLSLKCAINTFDYYGSETNALKKELELIKESFKNNKSRFNRDGIDRSRFSMDFYYPFLAGLNENYQYLKDEMRKFHVESLGIKCVIEEPWVTFAESSELIIALCRANDFKMAEQIFNEITNFKDSEGILPTGYQYAEKIFWPEEKSSWTNAAYVIAADCLFDVTGKDKAILS